MFGYLLDSVCCSAVEERNERQFRLSGNEKIRFAVPKMRTLRGLQPTEDMKKQAKIFISLSTQWARGKVAVIFHEFVFRTDI